MTTPLPTGELLTSTHGYGYAVPYQEQTHYGKLFPELTAMADPGQAVLQALAATMVDTEQPIVGGWSGTPTSGDNTAVPAGFTYLGQFIDHDLTFDPMSTLNRADNAGANLLDLRTARFDLDSLYGRGPDDEPYLYDQAKPGKLLIEPFLSEVGNFDLPRNSQGRALIGDPRNDIHMFLSQLHLAFARFHNAVIDALATQGHTGRALFAAAQREVVWHYQWIVTHEYLDAVVGEPLRTQVLTDAVLGGPGQQGTPAQAHLTYYAPVDGQAWIPYEFSAAAFRFGHSQVRPTYKINNAVAALAIFDPASPGGLNDFSGFRQRPAGWTIDWSLFFNTRTGTPPQPSRLVDTRIASALLGLPATVVTDGGPTSLPQRNLMRGVALDLPSGQDLASALGITPLVGTITDPSGNSLTIPNPAPLWYYMLAESQSGGGTRLGPTAGRVVAEVIVGILHTDPSSWLRVDPLWQPDMGATPGTFSIIDLLRVASTAT